MFDELWPTPPDLACKMWDKIKDKDGTILEPSAGKGDILDIIADGGWYNNRKHKIVAIEIDPDLRAILRQKGYKIIGEDFLSYEGLLSPSVIIMNPPFNHGAEHLMRAWEIMTNGEIVCLLNEQTILNPRGDSARYLSSIIAEHGEVEYLGSVFEDAERKTDVRVAMVYLTKKTDIFDFGVDFERSKPENVGIDQDNATVSADKVQAYVDSFNATIRKYVDYLKARQAIQFYAKSFVASPRIESIMKYEGFFGHPQEDYNRFVAELQEHAWEAVLSHKGFQSILTAKARKGIKSLLDEQKSMAFTADNIYKVMGILYQSKQALLEQCILDSFDVLTRYHIHNRMNVEGWLSNECWKVKSRCVLPYSGYYYSDDLNDIDRGICAVMGRSFDAITPITAVCKNKVGFSTFFKVRTWKRGTIHLYWLDKDVLDRFNYAAAAAKKWLKPA